MQQKSQALEKEFQTKVLDVLTADQRAKFLAAQQAEEACNLAMRQAQVKASDEREDALLRILGEAYRETAERNKKAMRGELGDSR